MIKLIATDMDGTFLDSNKQFDKEFVDTFFELVDKDIKFVIASGNQYYRLFQRFIPMSEDMYFIAENGTYIAHGATLIKTNVVSKKSVKVFKEIVKKYPNLRFILCGVKQAYVLNVQKEFENIVKMHYASYKYVDSFDDVDEDILKMSVNDVNNNISEFVDEIQPLLSDELKVVTAGNEWMDIQNKSINKGVGIKDLQKELNITPEECMAFGDQMNDYEMLKAVKYAYAMENAVQEIKDIAYDICPSNDKQGVIQTIKKEVLKSSD